MATLSVPLPRKISERQFVGDLMMLFERRRAKGANALLFENFASELEANHALRGDLFTLCTAISHMAAEDLTGEELLALVARALAGPGMAKGGAAPEIPESMRTAFLEGYAAWTNRATLAMAEPLQWPPEREVLVREPQQAPAPRTTERESELAESESDPAGGRSFKSALQIAMERSQIDLFRARPAVATERDTLDFKERETVEDSGAMGGRIGLFEQAVESGKGRVGKGVVFGVVFAAAGLLCGVYGFRVIHKPVVHRSIAANTVAPPAVIDQGGRVMDPAPAAPTAAIASQRATKALAAGGAAVAVPSDETGGSNSVVEYAPDSVRPVRPGAGAAGVGGTVMLEVSISKRGRVTEAHAVSGPPELYSRAERTVRQWRFKPSQVDGVPAEETTTLGIYLKGN